jgi:hypothetical protein
MWLARVSAALTLGMLLATAGCSTAQPNSAESTVPPTASDQRLESTLRCQDAWSGNVASIPEAPKAFGVSSVAWLGSPPNYSWPIADTTDGYAYTANGGKNYGAWKNPITVEAGMGERVISIDSPADAAIIVASAKDWESNQALRQGQLELPNSYTVTACTDHITQFPGMTLVRGPTCLVIRVTDPAIGKSSTVSVPMYGASCS